MKYSPIFNFALFKLILLIYIKSVWCKITRLALVGYEYTSAYSPLRAFFMRKILYAFACYGEAGEGHFRVCR